MMRTTTLHCLVLGALVLPAAAQEPDQTAPKGPDKAQAAEPEQPPAASLEELIDQLGDTAYKVRQRAERELRKRGDEALDALRDAAENHRDAEVRWRAGRLMRSLERGDRNGLLQPRDRGAPPRRGLQPWGGRDLDELFDSLFERLERDFDMDIPRHGFFQDEFFQDLRQQMQEMRARVDDFGPGSGAVSESQATRVEIGPDGVRVEVEEQDADGERKTKTYTAPDLESFREQYPDVARRFLDDGGGLRLRFSLPPGGFATPPGGFWSVPSPLGGAQPLPPNWAPAPRGGPVLGVRVEPVPAGLRGFLGLAEDQGLAVREVVEGSLADRLGIERGDLVLEIAGRAVGSPQDVSAALEAAGDEVVVRVNRRGEALTLKAAADAPADETNAGEGEGDGEAQGKLEPRRRTRAVR